MASFDEIRGFLAQVRGRLARTRAVEGLAITTLVLLGLVAASVLGAWVMHEERLPLLRAAAGAFLGLTILAGLARYGLMPWLRFRHDTAVARRVEEGAELSGSVLSCVELEAQLEEIQTSGRFDRGLIEALARDTARRLRRVDAGEIVTWRRSQRLGQALLGVTALLVSAILVFPEPFSEGARAMVYGAATKEARATGSAGELRDVVVGDITWVLHYPAYTRRSRRTLRNTAGDVSALDGTRLELETRSLEDAAEAQIVFVNGPDPLPLAVGEDGTLTGELTLRHTGMYHVRITRPDGTVVGERSRRIIEAEPDMPPEINLLQPVGDLEVEKGERVVLHFSSADDYGLAGVDLVTEIAGSADPAVRRRAVSLDGDRTTVGEARVDVQQAGALPGDTVVAWLEAVDTNTVSEEPGRTRSRKLRITLHSPEQRHKEIIEKERQLVDMMLDLLADRLESPVDAQRVNRYRRVIDAQSEINALTTVFLKHFKDVSDRLAGDQLARDDHKGDVATIFEQHVGLHNREQHLLDAARGEHRKAERTQHLAVLRRANSTWIEQLEHDIILLDRIIDEQHQERLVELARQLREANQQLIDLISQLKDNPDPALKMQLMQQIERLARQIERLKRDMRSNAKPVPYENMNVDAFEPSEQMQELGDMESTLDKIKRLVAEGKLDEAMRLAEQLANEVQELTTTLEADQNELRSQSASKRDARLQRAMRDLEKIAHREEGINRETTRLERAADDNLQELVRQELVPGIAEQMAEINELMRDLSKVDPKDMHADDKKRLETVKQQLEDLRETLSQEDLGQSAEMAKAIREELETLRDEVKLGAERLADRQGNTPKVARRNRNAHRLKKAVPPAKGIEKALKSMLPKPGDLLDRGEKRRLEKLAERQRRNQERLQRMRERAAQLDQDAPGIGAELSETLDGAERAMEKAEQSLREHRPGRAAEHEREVLDKLDEARKSIQDKLQPQDKRKGGGSGQGFGAEKVEIPDEERYAVPKEFRERLLEGMGHKAPSRYKPLIQRYYEALVQ